MIEVDPKTAMSRPPKRVCIVYDCLFPATVGGAERWYRSLAEAYVATGHDVTYLTLRQWERGQAPVISGVRVITAGPRLALYRDGKRRIAPPLVFGIGVFAHLLGHARRYDVIHTCSFPFFSVLSAAALKPLGRYRLVIDWFEVWTREYWREYLGPLGRIGWAVQALCARVPQIAFSFSTLHAQRLESLTRAPIHVLRGVHAETLPDRDVAATTPPEVVYAGRMIPEKRVDLLIEALALAMAERPDLHARIIGQGPEQERLAARIAELNLADRIVMPGFVSEEALQAAFDGATAIIQPSAREGFGLVVVEASARGVPVIVVEGADNSAVELVEQGANGLIAAPTPRALADAILTAARDRAGLRASTRAWWAVNRDRLSFATTFARIRATLRLDETAR